VLDPDVVVRTGGAAAAWGVADEFRGADAPARAFQDRAGGARLAPVGGLPGAVWAPGGRAAGAVVSGIVDGRIRSIDLVSNPDGLAALAPVFMATGEA